VVGEGGTREALALIKKCEVDRARFIDENGEGPGIRMRKRQQKKLECAGANHVVRRAAMVLVPSWDYAIVVM
jgi:hypothetical protein